MADQPIAQLKTCTKCGETKPLDDFIRVKASVTGRGGHCNICERVRSRAKYLRDPQKVIERTNRYRAAHPEQASEKSRRHRVKHAEKIKAYRERTRDEQAVRQRNWYEKNKEKVAAQSKAYQKAKPEVGRRSALKWRAKNIEQARGYTVAFYEKNPTYRADWTKAHPERSRASKKRFRERHKDNHKMRLDSAVSRAIRNSLGDNGSKGGRRWEKLVGYTIDELIRHLEAMFQPGMTWQNYGLRGWHIDHVIPLAVHNYDSPDHLDFRRAWALGNLQPLWAAENIAKSAKITAPFQPSLAL